MNFVHWFIYLKFFYNYNIMYKKIINLFTKKNTYDLSIKIKHFTINGNNFYI